MRLLNNPKSVVGRICWNWNRKRRKIVSVKKDEWDNFVVKTIDDNGNPNQAPYDGYFWDEELTRPLTLQEIQQC